MQKKVIVMGASFDPPHYGHAAMVTEVLGKHLADEVWLAPSPPRWDKTPKASIELRCQWARLMSLELRKLGYAVDVTLEELKNTAYRGSYFFLNQLKDAHPNICFSLLLGADSFVTIQNWRDPETSSLNGEHLLQEFEVVVFERETTIPDVLRAKQNVRILPALSQCQHTPSTFPKGARLTQLSSTHIRKSFGNGVVISDWSFPTVQESVLKANVY